MQIRFTERTVGGLLPPTATPQAYYWDAELQGFGVVVGRTGRKTFVVRARSRGELVKRTIGALGTPRPDGALWTVQLARVEARKLIGELASGKLPTTRRETRAGGPTLREGLAIHVAKMRITGGKGRTPSGERMPCSPRSIHTITTEVEKYLEAWLDRPIAELTSLALTEVCEDLRATIGKRAGSANPAGAALTKRLVSHVRAIWSSTDELHDLPGKMPKVATHSIAPKVERIEPHEFGTWRARVDALSPVRRDFNLLALFTAVRSEGLRHLRWDDVDFEERVIHVVRAKGNRPYTIPMTATVEEILRGRQRDNRSRFAELGGDAGWVLPTVTRSAPFSVIPLAEPKEYTLDADGARVKALLGPHALRKTWNSVALEERIPREEREALMNHEGQGVNVRHYGFPRNWDGLREAAAIVERGLLTRIAARPKRVKLRAVS